jgi:hypothetical protein
MRSKPAPRRISGKRLLVSLAVVILTFAVMAIFFWDFFYRVIVQPLYNLYVLIYYGINSIPQGVYHLIIVTVCFLIAVWTLTNAFARYRATHNRSMQATRDATSQDVESRYHFWRLETRHLRDNKFSRDHFAIHARRLILNILAHQEHLPYEDAEDLAESGRLKLPPQIAELIRTKSLDEKPKTEQPPIPLATRILRSLGFINPESDPFVDDKVNAIITFIEQRLEITHHESR